MLEGSDLPVERVETAAPLENGRVGYVKVFLTEVSDPLSQIDEVRRSVVNSTDIWDGEADELLRSGTAE